jgi:hypothetical protein
MFTVESLFADEVVVTNDAIGSSIFDVTSTVCQLVLRVLSMIRIVARVSLYSVTSMATAVTF